MSNDSSSDSRSGKSAGVVVDLSDIESLSRLPSAACADVSRAILALHDDDRMDFIRRFLSGLSCHGIPREKTFHGAFIGLILGVTDLVENDAAIVELFKTIAPEYTPGEFLSYVSVRRRDRRRKPVDVSDINAGFFRVRREKARLIKCCGAARAGTLGSR